MVITFFLYLLHFKQFIITYILIKNICKKLVSVNPKRGAVLV